MKEKTKNYSDPSEITDCSKKVMGRSLYNFSLAPSIMFLLELSLSEEINKVRKLLYLYLLFQGVAIVGAHDPVARLNSEFQPFSFTLLFGLIT